MTTYTVYNLALAIFVLLFSYWFAGLGDRRRNLLLSARIALLLTVLIYPWDFFAIRLGAWTYPNYDGWRIYGVPFNDSIFIWLCSYLACVVLVTLDNRRSANHGYSVGKKADS
jgi:lycopene cyclase domain-containing protein